MFMLNVLCYMRCCFVLIIVFFLLFVGCVKFDIVMEIKDENYVYFKSMVGVFKLIVSMLVGFFVFEFFDCNNLKGFVGIGLDGMVEKFEDNSYIGCIIVGEIIVVDFNKEDGM